MLNSTHRIRCLLGTVLFSPVQQSYLNLTFVKLTVFSFLMIFHDIYIFEAAVCVVVVWKGVSTVLFSHITYERIRISPFTFVSVFEAALDSNPIDWSSAECVDKQKCNCELTAARKRIKDVRSVCSGGGSGLSP